MDQDDEFSAEPRVTYSSGRAVDGSAGSQPDVRILHYNDVYHVDPSSAEPVGGLPRFITLCREYQEGNALEGKPKLLTLFSGDAFNPSLESSVTKGRHMVPALNAIGTDCACVGNHDFDFGVKQFQSLIGKCDFPWLVANILDPALGDDVPLGGAKKTHIITTSNGIKVGLIGLGEREWLETINVLPPGIIYKSATATAKELVPKLRKQGAEIVVCLSHMREPNDNKLAAQTDGIIDIILGGHDHFYNHSVVNGTHVLRSGSDFKQLSYIEARRRPGAPARWDFDIWRRDVMSQVPEHGPTVELVNDLTSKLQKSLSKAVGWTATPLDARFSTARLRESNIGNFVCDIMRHHSKADCTVMAAGTIRGDQVYPPGAIRIRDITTCFPFEDPAVVLRVTGQAIWDALENSVSTYPALEGRFPQVSNIEFEFDPNKESGKRLTYLRIGGETYEPERKYVLATRGYMGRGKDGYTSLLVKSEGGDAEEIIDEEHGMLISAMIRQYFMGLRTIGQWKHLADHWVDLAEKVEPSLSREVSRSEGPHEEPSQHSIAKQAVSDETSHTWSNFLQRRMGLNLKPVTPAEDTSDDEDHVGAHGHGDYDDQMGFEILLMRKFWALWACKAGVQGCVADSLKQSEYSVDWTRVIAPVVEGRIKIVGEGQNVA